MASTRIRLATALVLAAPVGVLAQHQTARAATIDVTTTVDEVSNNGQTSLREAVNVAVDGDVVAIPAGTYELACPGPEDQTNVSGDLDIVNKSITLRGPTTGTATVRPAPGCQERVIDVVDFGTPNAVTIERLTIRGGRPVGTSTGAGVNASFSTATSLTIRDSIVTDNRGGNAGAGDAASGGGVYVDNAGTLLIERSTISNNSVGTGGGGVTGWKAGGGGVAFRGFSSTPGTVTVVDSTIANNVGGVAARGGGGGLWIDALDVTLTGVAVVDNTIAGDPTGRASGNGAGITINPINPADRVLDVTITRGEISGNTIGSPSDAGAAGPGVFGGHGGGLFVEADGGSLLIDGTVFDGNAAGDGGAQTGGVGSGGSGGNVHVTTFSSSSIDPLDVAIVDAEIRNGTAGSSSGRPGGNGGGVHAVTGQFDLGSEITVTGSTFRGNSAGDGTEGGAGGGLYARSSTSNTAGSIAVTDSTFEDNSAGDGVDVASGSGGNGGAGGGAWLYVDGPAVATPLIALDGSTFADNRAGAGGASTAGTGGFGGPAGGLLVIGAEAEITGSTLTSNTSGDGGQGATGGPAGDGGGLHVTADAVTVSASTFERNATGRGGTGTSTTGSSGGDGGGAFFELVEPALIEATRFVDNATGAGGDGATGGGPGGFGGGAAFELDAHPERTRFVDVTATVNTTGDGGDSPTGNAGPGGFGGAFSIRAADSLVEFERSEVSGNRTGDAGSGSTASNAFGGSGGGIWLTDASQGGGLFVDDSEISDNRTGSGGTASQAGAAAGLAGSGGGVFAALGSAGDGNIAFTRTSITGNVTGDSGQPGSGGVDPPGGSGGGAHLTTGTLGQVSIGNSTISGNRAGSTADGAPKGDGGGLSVAAPTGLLTLSHVTLGGNDARNGAAVLSGAASVAIDRTVIADSVRTGNNPAQNCRFVGAANTSGGYNVETHGDTCDFDAATDIRNFAGPTLSPLADNGGPGLSQLPLVTVSTSVVLDRIPAADCTWDVDQRGIGRPVGSGCDVGAIESRPSITAVDDVIEVSGTSTDVDFVANDLPTEATLDEVTVTLPRQPAEGTLVFENGDWRFVSPQTSGAFVDFEYRVCLGATDICDTATVTLVPAGTSRFVSLQPARVFDTRTGTAAPGPKGTIPAGGTIDVQITGVAGVPTSGVAAVALNVTAARIDDAGYVTAYPTGSTRPETSNLNVPGPGATVPNMVVVPVGAGGKVSFYSFGATNLIADVAGYFTEGGVSTDAGAPGARAGRLVPISPTRVFDNRPDTSEPGPKGELAAGETIEVQIAGRAGVPTSGVSAVVMNLTWTRTPDRGFVTAFPSGTSLPTASNLNATGPNQTVANLVIVPLGDGGRVSLYTDVGGYLLGDVTGYVTDGTAPRSLSGLFVPLGPGRVFDTRPDKPDAGPKGYVDAGGTIVVEHAGVAGVPAIGVGAVVTNVTAVRSGDRGYITVWPDGLPRPNASTLNLSAAGETRPNAAVLPLGTGGRMRLFSFPGSHLLADVFGWFLD